MSPGGVPAPDPERQAPPIAAEEAAWLERQFAGLGDPTATDAPHDWPPKRWRRRARRVADTIITDAISDVGDRATVDIVFDVLQKALEYDRRSSRPRAAALYRAALSRQVTIIPRARSQHIRGLQAPKRIHGDIPPAHRLNCDGSAACSRAWRAGHSRHTSATAGR